MIYWFFGYPGIGKDHLAKQFSKKEKILYINGDLLLTKAEKEKLALGVFTKKDRLIKLKRIAKYLIKINKDLAITDSLPDKQSRNFLLKTFKKNIKFILIEASEDQHLAQIKNRKNHFFKAEMIKNYIAKNWEPIGKFPHSKINNVYKPTK